MSFKRTNVLIIAAIVAISGTGCTFLRPPKPEACEYRSIPEGYLQPCELPAAPLDNGLLSESFVQAMKCAQLGNDDKARIRELITSPDNQP